MTELSPQDEQEFVSLLVSHQSLIRAYIISLLPGVSEAEDVIQNTSKVLWEKRAEFTIGTNFKAWALTTARFQAMALQQTLHRERRQPLDDDVMEIIAEHATTTEVDDLNHQFNALNDCISQLPLREQELVLHRYWKKSTLAKFAHETGQSVGALKVALHRAREKLRVCLERKKQMRERTT